MSMALPKFSSVFNSSRYLRQVQPSGFNEYYCGPRACVLELLAMTIGFVLPEHSESLPPDWQSWALGLDYLQQWVRLVIGNVSQYAAWEGLKTEAGNMLGDLNNESLQSLDLDNTRLFEAIALRFWVNIVWFEEKSSVEIRTRYYRVPQAGFPCPFVFMGLDLEGSIYAFHHPLQNDPSNWGIPALQPPIVIGTPPFPDDPDHLFRQLGFAIVNAVNSVPFGTFSPAILQDSQSFLSSWKELGKTVPESLQPPLDSASLNGSLQRLFGSSSPTVYRRSEHQIIDCENHPDFGEFILHGKPIHKFHATCLRNFIDSRRSKAPRNRPIQCPVCLKPLSEKIFEDLNQEVTQKKSKLLRDSKQSG